MRGAWTELGAQRAFRCTRATARRACDELRAAVHFAGLGDRVASRCEKRAVAGHFAGLGDRVAQRCEKRTLDARTADRTRHPSMPPLTFAGGRQRP
jgi:hypothetical protein